MRNLCTAIAISSTVSLIGALGATTACATTQNHLNRPTGRLCSRRLTSRCPRRHRVQGEPNLVRRGLPTSLAPRDKAGQRVCERRVDDRPALRGAYPVGRPGRVVHADETRDCEQCLAATRRPSSAAADVSASAAAARQRRRCRPMSPLNPRAARASAWKLGRSARRSGPCRSRSSGEGTLGFRKPDRRLPPGPRAAPARSRRHGAAWRSGRSTGCPWSSREAQVAPRSGSRHPNCLFVPSRSPRIRRRTRRCRPSRTRDRPSPTGPARTPGELGHVPLRSRSRHRARFPRPGHARRHCPGLALSATRRRLDLACPDARTLVGFWRSREELTA